MPPQGGRKHPHQEFIQVDTSSVLFICGGAFVGLDKIIESRVGRSGMGFGAEIKSREERRVGDLLAMIQPEDLLKYGLIPEFVGRLPVIATLHDLDEPALVRILKEPKNAIIKQYQKYFDLEKVRLKFTDDAVAAIAKEALKRGTGARGLRAILEEVMLEIMYELPSIQGLKECVITREVILNRERPVLVSEAKEQTRLSGTLFVVATPIGNLEDITAARAPRAAGGRPDRLRGHAADPGAAHPLRHPHADHRPTTSTTSSPAGPQLLRQLGDGQVGGARHRRRHAGHLRPRLPARPRRPRRRGAGGAGAGALGASSPRCRRPGCRPTASSSTASCRSSRAGG